MSYITLALFISTPVVWLSMFIFGTVLFRYKASSFQMPILYSTFILSIISFIIHLNQIAMLVTIVQPLAFVFCFKYLFRFIWSHAITMTLIVYALGITVEWSIHGIYAILADNILVDTIVNNDFSLSIYIPFILHILSCIIQQYRLGFTFVHAFDASPSGMIIMLLAILGFISIGTTSLNLYLLNSLPFAIYGQSILSVTIIILVVCYYLQELKKE